MEIFILESMHLDERITYLITVQPVIYATQKIVDFGEKWKFVDFIYAWLYMGYGIMRIIFV